MKDFLHARVKGLYRPELCKPLICKVTKQQRCIISSKLVVAERSEANNRDLWASESQLAFIYIYIYPVLTALPSVTATGVQRCESYI